MKITCIIGFLAAGIALSVGNAMADGGGQGFRGNPVETLPKVHTPSEKVEINVKAHQNDALKRLLATHLTPTRFAISGVKSIPFQEVAALFARLAHKDVTVGNLVQIAKRVTELYRTHGYVLSFAYVPAQKFAGGVVRIAVVEGYVKDVKIEGDPGGDKRRILAMAQHMAEERPLTSKTFERYANALGLLPGVQVKVTLPPPQTTDGATRLIVDVQRKSVTVGTALDFLNPGVRSIVTATTNAITPLGGQLRLSALVPGDHYDEEYYAANYSQPLGSKGLLLKLDASHYKAKPDGVQILGAKFSRGVENDKAGFSLSYPFVLQNAERLTGVAGLYASHNRDRYVLEGSNLSATLSTRLRIAHVGFSYIDATAKRRRNVDLQLYQGLDVAGAGQTGDFYDLDFLRARGRITLTNVWPHHFGTVVSAAWQYSADNLPSSEQISFGGTYFGSAYPPGEVAGDSGWGASIEINREIKIHTRYLRSVRPYVSFDNSHVSLNSASLQHNHLASVAIGMRLSDGKHYSIGIGVAFPTGDLPTNSDKRAPRLTFAYSYQL